ncbi:MAG: helicase RepA family protein [Acidibrevibacterium sp.]|uniref:AAA family ATPase n=1 Tax=Acidibrevibacterium fodinaquatile TaxID=1969806 RepID=UPI0023A84CE1|nr:AAA family ATPase [Acidibrevibacterium fodinaquatile]MCA7118420.1 helicase RepA family protein [Acidibrevibacterium fodinaquatile]
MNQDPALAPGFEFWPALPAPPLRATPALLPPPAAIAPRPWLYGTALVAGFVSLLVAPGGVGKSALAIGEALALASGRALLGERVHHPVGVWLLNLEDPLDEIERRVAAAMLQHGLTRADLGGRLFLHSGRDRRIVMAEESPDGGIVFPDQEAICRAAQEAGIGCLIVDPFVRSHHLEENSNPHMDAAATAWAEVAHASGAAVLLVHHVRKGAAPDAEAARGAKALTDAARIARILSPMSDQEGEEMGIPAAERARLVRLDDVKANLAPRAGRAAWYRLESVALGNATEAYPRGDHVQAITRFRPPTVWAKLSPADCNEALDAIAAGPGLGLLYAAHRRGRGSERWAGRVLIERFRLTEAEAARVIGAWLENGLLVECEYRDREQRKQRQGVRVIDARRPLVPHQQGDHA